MTELDALKESATVLVGDARESLLELNELLGGFAVDPEYRAEGEKAATDWRAEVDRIIEIQDAPTLSQAEAIGIVNAAAGDHHVVVNAAGSMPGDLHRLWRPSGPKAYDLKYAIPRLRAGGRHGSRSSRLLMSAFSGIAAATAKGADRAGEP